ncbi:MAG: glycosyltransferase [Candidatus Binatia bacterium]|nr:glycosyltransferase [Candidatus Binatia bacterium]
MNEVGEIPEVLELTLSVIVPVYNERATIWEILQRVVRRPEVDQLVIVDDCSADGTGDVLRAGEAAGWPELRRGRGRPLPEIVVRYHRENRGKGAALRTGFEVADRDVFLTQDADLEYDPDDYPRLLVPLRDGRADAVYGSRFAGYPRRVLFFWHSLGNKLLTTLSNMLCDLNLTDMETGYKAMRKEMVRAMVLKSNRFGIEPEMTAKLARLRARIYEVPISYSGRSYSEGKKIGWKDAVSAIWTMFRCAFTDDRESSDPLHATLRRMAALDRYNTFLFEQIRPFVGQHVLEVGAGTGTITQFVRDRDRTLATDIDEQYLHLLRRRFENYKNVDAALFDLGEPAPAAVAANTYDTIICLNVLEHIADDRGALQRMFDLLEPGGKLVLLVPAHGVLYGDIDKAIGHHRRYEKDPLSRLLAGVGFETEELFFVNALSTLGWYVNGRLLKRNSVPGMQARVADRLVPFFKLERKLNLPFGLSLISVAKRPMVAGESGELSRASGDH